MAKKNATPAAGITNAVMASGFPKLVSMVAKTAAANLNLVKPAIVCMTASPAMAMT